MKRIRARRSSVRRGRRKTFAKSLSLEQLEQRLVLHGASHNQPPVNVVPSGQSMAAGTTLVFSTANNNRISTSDPDAGTGDLAVTLTVSSGTLTLGSLTGVQFSQGDGSLDPRMTFTGSQADINAVLSNVSFVPPTNFGGAATLTICTNDLGHSGSGGAKSDTDKITIAIVPPNAQPQFIKGNDQTVLEDSGPQKVTAWATAISAGSIQKSKPKLSFVVTNDNPTLFSTPPSIASNGTLTYTPAANASGSASVTVRLKNSSGTESTPQSFTINVSPVNDCPSFVKGRDQTVLEDSGPTTITRWASRIVAGPSNESFQTVTFLVSNNNAALFSAAPTISPDGTLSFTPSPNANGTAKITVRAKDSGGSVNHGVDTSSAQTFCITVKPINDAPSFVKGPNQSVPKGSGTKTVISWATTISAGPADESKQKLSFLVSTEG